MQPFSVVRAFGVTLNLTAFAGNMKDPEIIFWTHGYFVCPCYAIQYLEILGGECIDRSVNLRVQWLQNQGVKDNTGLHYSG